MNQKQLKGYLKKLNTKLILIPFILIVLISAGIVVAQQMGFSEKARIFPKGVQYVPDKILVKYKEGQSPDELKEQGKMEQRRILTNSLTVIGVVSSEKLFPNQKGLQNYYQLTLKKGLSIPQAYESLKNIPEIENATPDYILRIQSAPNDPYFSQMWNLSQINMEKAWDTSHTDGVMVAVIDTGVDYNHQDLAGMVIKGRNFVDNNDDPMDDQGHGTHVAGIFGAITNNSIGISGVSWGAKILAIKGCDKTGDCSTTNVSRAIQYAADHGAKIINISIAGAGSCNGTYTDMVKYASQKGSLIIAAAGNGNNDGIGVNADTQIPASCDGVLAVGSVDVNGNRSVFSNYGSKVEISAPGGQGPCSIPTCILSTSPGNGYTLRAGTSMAAPHVSGVAALLLSHNRSLSSDAIKSCLIRGADDIKTDKPIGPRLNPSHSLVLCSPVQKTPTPTPTISVPASSIAGTVYVDRNENQRMDLAENGFAGAQVVLSGLTSDSVLSNSRGRFVFPNLKPGLYTISITVKGQSVGAPTDIVLSKSTPSARLDIPIPPSLAGVSPIPTPTASSQKTQSGCFIDPKCAEGGNSVQVCSFQCYP